MLSGVLNTFQNFSACYFGSQMGVNFSVLSASENFRIVSPPALNGNREKNISASWCGRSLATANWIRLTRSDDECVLHLEAYVYQCEANFSNIFASGVTWVPTAQARNIGAISFLIYYRRPLLARDVEKEHYMLVNWNVWNTRLQAMRDSVILSCSNDVLQIRNQKRTVPNRFVVT